MFGPDIMVAMVMELGMRQREVIPSGGGEMDKRIFRRRV
jgi:alpha-glucosidase (family GH31 glycosyl hydrolase)